MTSTFGAQKRNRNMQVLDNTKLLEVLKRRFTAHAARHPRTEWKTVEGRLKAHPAKLHALLAMEQSGGEPDVVELDGHEGQVVYIDCSPESPAGRRSLCYDHAGWLSRKEHRPAGNAVEQAAAIGIELLTEDQYYQLQQYGMFDQKTSSWLKTPDEVRAQGGAIFGDRRYGRVFVYHNGAQSYYAARGFRGCLSL